MRIRKSIAVVFIVGMLLGNLTACVPVKEALPEDTIEEYEDAYNAMDIQAMLDCMDEKSVKSLTAGMNVAVKLAKTVTGVDLGISGSDIMDLVPLVQAMLGDSFAAQVGGISQVDFQVKETYIKGNRATVYITEANTGQNMVVNMTKNNGKWYMSLSTMTISKTDADRVIIAGEDEKEKGSEKRKLSEEDKKEISDVISEIMGMDGVKEAVSDLLGGSGK